MLQRWSTGTRSLARVLSSTQHSALGVQVAQFGTSKSSRGRPQIGFKQQSSVTSAFHPHQTAHGSRRTKRLSAFAALESFDGNNNSMGNSTDETVREFTATASAPGSAYGAVSVYKSAYNPSSFEESLQVAGGGLIRGWGAGQSAGLNSGQHTTRQFSSEGGSKEEEGGKEVEGQVEGHIDVEVGMDDVIADETDSEDYTIDKDLETPPPTPASDSSSSYEPLANIDPSALKYKIKKYERMALPPYHHPNEFKVVLEVYVKDLKLSDKAVDALIDIVGPRYNPNKKLLKLTCNKFDTRVENRNYLVWLLDSLLHEAEGFHDDDNV